MNRKPRGYRGGVLLDAFLILILCIGTYVAWRTRGRWRELFAKIPVFSDLRAPVGRTEFVKVDLNRRSASAQSSVRRFLAESGIGEKHIVKSFNEARRSGGGASWLESTIEIAPPRTFQSGPFLKNVAVFLSKNDLTLMRDETGGGNWTLEFGDREHVFQRLVIHGR